MKKIIIGWILILIILISFISIRSYFSQKRVSTLPKEEIAPEIPKITLPKTIYNLAGVIQKLEKNFLSFEATIPQLDEKGQPLEKTETRTALITPATKLTRLTFVATEDPKRKTPQETEIAFKDLRIGDYIEVISNQDISRRTEFEAIQIRVLPKSF